SRFSACGTSPTRPAASLPTRRFRLNSFSRQIRIMFSWLIPCAATKPRPASRTGPAPPRDRGQRLCGIAVGAPHHRDLCRFAGQDAAPVTLTAEARTNRGPAPPPLEVEEPALPPLQPTRLPFAHVLAGVGFLVVAATTSILVGPAGL